jgi:hypothetical protein
LYIFQISGVFIINKVLQGFDDFALFMGGGNGDEPF